MIQVGQILFLAVFLLVWSDGLRAEYDPERCPDAQEAEARMQIGDAGVAIGKPAATAGMDMACSTCCQGPITQSPEVPVAEPGPVTQILRFALPPDHHLHKAHFESFRPPRI